MHPATEFLNKLYPQGPWLLTALPVEADHPKKKSPPTQTFMPGQEANVVSWLKDMEGGAFNFYFSVNPPKGSMSKKARRLDIKEMAYLHVDIDPKKGEDPLKAKDRIEALLTNELPDGLPVPTCVVDSGGGYWGFWRLAEPVPIAGDEAKYEEAKLYNLHLETMFGADSCHNVDRIARLPGTVNYPDAKKRAKGRKVCDARVLYFGDDTYPITRFTKAPQVAVKRDGFSTGRTVKISENVERLTLEDLPRGLPDLCKRVISMGEDEVDEDKFDSRSDALWYVVCELVRQDCTDDQIYSIITDPDWGISESVIDGKNGRPEDYARRQIERAREYAEDPILAEFNNKYAVVQNTGGGSCRIVYEEEIEGGARMVLQTPTDFKAYFSNQFVTIQIQSGNNTVARQIPAGRWWFENPSRRSYKSIVFLPGQEVADDIYNLWRGFAYEAKPGGCCDQFLDLMEKSICDNNQELYEYLLNWMALAVQKPDQPGHTAIVMRSGQGTGKGTFAKTFYKLFGRHGKQITNALHLTGHFNAHLRDCVVLFADEAVAADDRNHEAVLKTIITEEDMALTPKGKEMTVEKNYLHVIMASNSKWVVPTGYDDRRFVVLDVNEDHKTDIAYWNLLNKELANGGYEALLYLLATRDLTGFNPRDKPSTMALQEQKTLSFDPLERWLYGVLQDGLVGEVVLTEGTTMYGATIAWDYNARVNSAKRVGNHTIFKFLSETFTEGFQRKQVPIDKCVGPIRDANNGQLSEDPPGKPRCYIFPSLADMRAQFDARFGGPYPWVAEPDSPERIPTDAF
tara:strand:- start:27283 stop:29673 length:2391 start_codon:yes stop_codon:yes gene_type:complete